MNKIIEYAEKRIKELELELGETAYIFQGAYLRKQQELESDLKIHEKYLKLAEEQQADFDDRLREEQELRNEN